MTVPPAQTEPEGPLLRVVRGEPSATELAALLAVVAAYAAPAGKSQPAHVPSTWSAPAGGHQRPLPTGAGAWLVSGWQPGVRTRAAF